MQRKEYKVIEFTPEKLKQLREDYGLTQIRLYELTGISRQTISAMENGSRPISGSTNRMLNLLFRNLHKDELLRKLIVGKKIEMTNILKSTQLESIRANEVPSLIGVIKILDEIKMIIGD